MGRKFLAAAAALVLTLAAAAAAFAQNVPAASSLNATDKIVCWQATGSGRAAKACTEAQLTAYLQGVLALPASAIASGTLAAARLPNPSASTLGGVESFAAVSHQWLRQISTSGVPAASQPACADLSDAVNLCNTGLSAALDSLVGSAQGTLAYRGASGWTALAPGTSGQFLQTLGASANPAWAPAPTASYASDAQYDAAASAVVAVTPQNFGHRQSIGANGYQKLPGGLILQWGFVSAVGASSTVSVTYPTACSSATYNVQATSDTGGTNAGPSITAVSTSGFSVRNNMATPADYYWMSTCS